MPDQNETAEERKTMIGFVVYGIILLGLIVVYRDFMITAVAVFVFIVFLVMHIVPRIREKRKREEKKP